MYIGMKAHLMNQCIKVPSEYTDKATEAVAHHDVKWKPTRKGQKPFLPNNRKPPRFPLKNVKDEILKPNFFHSSPPHSVKPFADDLSVFSSSVSDHQSH